MECMCAQTKPWFIPSSERVLGEWSQNPRQLQGKTPLYRKNFPQKRIEPMTQHQAGQQVQHDTSELFRPLINDNKVVWCFTNENLHREFIVLQVLSANFNVNLYPPPQKKKKKKRNLHTHSHTRMHAHACMHAHTHTHTHTKTTPNPFLHGISPNQS